MFERAPCINDGTVLVNLSTLGLRYWFSGGGPQAEMEIFTLCLFGNGQMCGRRHAAPWERDIYDGASDVRPTALLFSSPVRDLKPSVGKFHQRYIVVSGHQGLEQSLLITRNSPCPYTFVLRSPLNPTHADKLDIKES